MRRSAQNRKQAPSRRKALLPGYKDRITQGSFEKAHKRGQKAHQKASERANLLDGRKCQNCDREMPTDMRIHAKYCSGACRAEASRKRRGLE